MTLSWLFYVWRGGKKAGKMLLYFTANDFFMLNKLSRFSVFLGNEITGAVLPT